MSSSKIIRRGCESSPFLLGPLGTPPAQPTAQEEFRAVRLGAAEPDPEPELEEEPEPPPPCIPEEEALRRIQQAHAEGFKKGKQQAEEDLAKVGEALAQGLLSIGGLRGQLLREAEDDLLKLSVLIARKVMMRELTLDPRMVIGLVQGALELASEEGEILVRLNPDEYQVVAYSPQFEALSRERKRITLREDPSLPPAGCVVETVRGNIEAGIEPQLEEIFRRLFEERNAQREEVPGD